MAYITDKKSIFFVTSPRTPFKMIDEVKLLIELYEGLEWNKYTQTAFAKKLSESSFFDGRIDNNLDFAARDRINRSPKSLGFVNLTPKIQLTDAGRQFLYGKRPQEILFRQLIKFQLPSPYHIDKNSTFNIKPYLELIRMTRVLNGLSKDEIAIFIMQLKHFNQFEQIKEKIISFRETVKSIDHRQTSYRREVKRIFDEEIAKLYDEEILAGDILTRQSNSTTLDRFIETKENNFRDYADAAIRYLRSTELLSYEYKTNRLVISKYRLEDIDFILENVERNAVGFSSEDIFKEYLYSDRLPELLTDNKSNLISEIQKLGSLQNISELSTLEINQLKDKRDSLLETKKTNNLNTQVLSLKTYEEYEDIINVFDDISAGTIVDPALVFEWNTWRAFVMLNDGDISGNFKFDLQGMPLFNAPGNKPDIECKYDKFNLIVEVTLSTGQKQYEMEGEPVPRHLSQHKKETGQDTYCLFVTKKLNPATLAHFYALHKIDIAYYGGKAKIIPLEVKEFKTLLKTAYLSTNKPKSIDIYNFVNSATEVVKDVQNESDWYESITALTEHWYPRN